MTLSDIIVLNEEKEMEHEKIELRFYLKLFLWEQCCAVQTLAHSTKAAAEMMGMERMLN